MPEPPLHRLIESVLVAGIGGPERLCSTLDAGRGDAMVMIPLVKHSRRHAARAVEERLTIRTVVIIATGKVNCTRKRTGVGPNAAASPIRQSARLPMTRPAKMRPRIARSVRFLTTALARR